MYACMTPVGLDTSDKFENHWSMSTVGKVRLTGFLFLARILNSNIVS